MSPGPFLALFLASALVGARCPSKADTPLPTGRTTMSSGQQSFTTLLSAATSSFTEPAELVVRDAAGLASLWSGVHGGRPGNPPPQVDFSRSSVVVLALGARRTAGYSVRLDSISGGEDGAVAHYTELPPGAGCVSAQVLTSPVQIVRVPRLPAEVRFERRVAPTSC
jgi:hypothetical protein